MNINNSSSTQKVTSKYFSSNSGMDESLSDFQVKKQFAAPKNSNSKLKTKKPLKKPRGQKDIRTALKSKKSELVTYSEDFDSVCKQSGIDVDSEQLQLAIALSKSIQPSTCDSQNSQLSSQERTARIRSTLQEYGFTVPEIKISNTNRKVKRFKKNFKLLLVSDSEKEQNIANKYSQVLLQNISQPLSPTKKTECNSSDSKLFHLTTNVSYETVRDNNLYYIESISFDKSLHKGSLLKNWSEIPGRPVSPKLMEDFTMDLSEILCSQEELNILLSGPLKNVKKLIRNKVNHSQKNKDIDVAVIDDSDNLTVNKSKEQAVSSIARSLSPDMFDDEPTSFQDMEPGVNKDDYQIECDNKLPSDECATLLTSTEKVQSTVSGLSQFSQKWDITRRKSNDVMELTECVGETINSSSGCTTRKDVSKSKFDDFMELTECVIKPIVHIEGSVDLTQNSDENIIQDNRVNTKENIESIDLTQSPNSNNTLPLVHVSGKRGGSLEETVILNDNKINRSETLTQPDDLKEAISQIHENQDFTCDLTARTSPKKSKSVEDSVNDSFFEDFLYNHSNSPEQNEKPELEINCEAEIDLTQSPEQVTNVSSNYSTNNESLNYLDMNDKPEIDLTQSPEYMIEKSISESELSQESVAYNEATIDNIYTDKVELCNKSLGKKNDVSIDYDELSHKTFSMNETNIDLSIDVNSKSLSQHSEIMYTSQKSHEAEVFEISDNELDYSMHQSRYEDCFGGISIVESNTVSKRISNYQMESFGNKTGSESFLPEVNVKLSKEPLSSVLSPVRNDIDKPFNLQEVNLKNHETPIETYTEESPIKNNVYDIVKTPSNNEYVMKTDQVTPISDYASMSTPDRNKELDKYGLKPLKRKRAIQLLTHIYNQTHPIVEPCTSEVIQSPTKKRKTETTQVNSPRKSPITNTLTRENIIVKNQASPNKRKIVSISPIKNWNENYEVKENIYEVTNDYIEVRNMECAEEDWVFQKREKAKLHSCRVPLHIAFHNYVSRRQRLQEAILRYEPIEIDVIHKDLVADGHRYDPKDLLKFLDKKCITVKTADNTTKSNRK
ncbi:structure-specific endonuclease subunit SLX4 [Amyelois transitella]|uniref:structure-specific endonuclease subunit SLX4 n=1 Tax=Amyelois transitella TaxID=680683 RepID=UPI00067D47A1|nr:structure-specific endonuclease subunit SLX4 [Amyelois transitella]